ncbi:phosphatidylinositol kinase [Nocardioides psychrotolerans]|uniref:Serine/threonine-protein kinase HipA n=1 Tax=Nocardioides psychrotolerans TaxID=1005945 RepID=A0A1I3P9F5_9ACTN|nr:type II toxin-antitoxin system HipA family toxin [Nocardioides psychrotolerans]GEP39619.1 phosphatidylinositol kinase [Nocardioides psychrotolerans]SFJ18155.1 serine/threonine-protein kinase HipA [Nocardioides psychrotolerans]
MTGPPTTRVHVTVEIGGTAVKAGTAFATERRGVTSVVFDYDPGYLANRRSYPLSPDLSLGTGKHSLAGLPGCFADSAPDRWGRSLIAKRARARARDDGRQLGSIQEVDYLLGVSDPSRQGALRFSLTEGGPYLGTEPDVPKLVALPRLLRAADAVATDGDDDMGAVKELLDAGSGSLGGARPKASVHDGDNLLIAKFPHQSDEWDVMAWEMTALDLAERCGIRVPDHQLVDVGGRSVLLLDRFDRDMGTRVGYVSAMTLLRVRDQDRADYLEMAEALSEHGSQVSLDLAELWRRIAFSLIINNVDDHLRNHGFLRATAGWRLSPAFDINPHPDPRASRATTIGYADTAETAVAALFASAADFGLDDTEARAVWAATLAGTASWREVATANGISTGQCDRFAAVMDRFGNPRH